MFSARHEHQLNNKIWLRARFSSEPDEIFVVHFSLPSTTIRRRLRQMVRCGSQEETQQRMVITSVHLSHTELQHDPGEAIFVQKTPLLFHWSTELVRSYNAVQSPTVDAKLRTSSSRSVGEGANAIGPVIYPVNNQPSSVVPSVTCPGQSMDVMEAVARPVDSVACPTWRKCSLTLRRGSAAPCALRPRADQQRRLVALKSHNCGAVRTEAQCPGEDPHIPPLAGQLEAGLQWRRQSVQRNFWEWIEL